MVIGPDRSVYMRVCDIVYCDAMSVEAGFSLIADSRQVLVLITLTACGFASRRTLSRQPNVSLRDNPVPQV